MTEASGDPGAPTALERMLEARSVAVVGASVQEGSLGQQMMVELQRGGFDGAIYPVNPGYDEVLGLRCSASIADLPNRSTSRSWVSPITAWSRRCATRSAAGARSAVTFSSLHEEEPPRRRTPAHRAGRGDRA